MVHRVDHNCGIAVAHTLHDAYRYIRALQHRGREAAGIAAIGDDRIDAVKWVGQVHQLNLESLRHIFPRHGYHTFFAHVRYATRGRKDRLLEDAHPHVKGGEIKDNGNHVIIRGCESAIIHNGQMARGFLDDIVDRELLHTGCDSEELLHLFDHATESEIMRKLPGSYTLAVAKKNRKDIIVMRDSSGRMPGALIWKNGKYDIVSEGVAARKNGATFVEDLQPGCIYHIYPDGSHEKECVVMPNLSRCFFQYNYLAHDDTVLDGVSVRALKRTLGMQLAEEFDPRADFVTYVPECPEPAARAYANKRGLPFVPIFYKFKGERAFQGSTALERNVSISKNLFLKPEANDIPVEDYLRGKTMIVLEDSIVRGNNGPYAVSLLKEMGVKKVYLAVYTPPIGIIGSDGVPRGCYSGIDMSPSDNFAARNSNVEQISQKMDAEVGYLSVDKMLEGFMIHGLSPETLCTFCIGGPNHYNNDEAYARIEATARERKR